MKLRSYSIALGLLAVACSGSDGAAGANGTNGNPGDPGKVDSSASLVSPSQGLLDRVVDVEIGGSGTKFTDNDKPDFGAGIQVLESHAASATLLVAKIQIAKDAALGKRDVTVGTAKATGAFSVIPAINVSVAGQPVSVEQGGVVQFDIENNDTKAFDTNAFKLEATGVVDLGSSATSAQAATGFILAAPLAQPSKGQISVSNLDAQGAPKISFLSDPQGLEVKARAAVALPFGAGADQTFDGTLSSKFFKLTPNGAASIVDLRMQVTDAKAATLPYVIVFGGAAKTDADQLLIAGPPASLFGPAPPPYDIHAAIPLVAGGTDLYAVLVDLGKTAGDKVTLTPSTVNATKIAESASPHGGAAPQAIGTLPPQDGFVVDASLGAAGEIDAYLVTGAINDVVQIAASSAADVQIIITSDPTTPDDDTKWLTDPIAAGVKFGGSASWKLTAANAYLVVRADSRGKVATGKYALSARKIP
jgi:hypothetical protein